MGKRDKGIGLLLLAAGLGLAALSLTILPTLVTVLSLNESNPAIVLLVLTGLIVVKAGSFFLIIASVGALRDVPEAKRPPRALTVVALILFLATDLPYLGALFSVPSVLWWYQMGVPMERLHSILFASKLLAMGLGVGLVCFYRLARPAAVAFLLLVAANAFTRFGLYRPEVTRFALTPQGIPTIVSAPAAVPPSAIEAIPGWVITLALSILILRPSLIPNKRTNTGGGRG